MGEPTYRLKRAGSSNGDWFVIDLATDRTLGTVFKYLGYWWADSAGDMRNRRSTKECAADLVAFKAAHQAPPTGRPT